MADQPQGSAERARPPVAAPPANHGHTTAAWVTVSLVVVGALVAAAAVVAAQGWLFWLGIGVVVVGVVVGLVLRALGLGQPDIPSRAGARSGQEIDASKEHG